MSYLKYIPDIIVNNIDKQIKNILIGLITDLLPIDIGYQTGA